VRNAMVTNVKRQHPLVKIKNVICSTCIGFLLAATISASTDSEVTPVSKTMFFLPIL